MAVAETLDNLSYTCHRILGPNSNLGNDQKETLGARIRQELVPYLTMANIPFRFYSKPRGYAGDFLTIVES